MKERPIPFSAPMVRAVLNGSKTQTRRAMRHQPHDDTTVHVEAFNQTVVDRHGEEQPGPEIFGAWWDDGESGLRCPYGGPGDQLWVREAWSTHSCFDAIPPRDLTTRSIHYLADGPCQTGKYRPAMFMPRWASRIQLEVTEVRVERLNAISEADCIAEGAPGGHGAIPGYGYSATPAEHYRHIWEAINGPGSWEANPYVWVVAFQRSAIRRAA